MVSMIQSKQQKISGLVGTSSVLPSLLSFKSALRIEEVLKYGFFSSRLSAQEALSASINENKSERDKILAFIQ